MKKSLKIFLFVVGGLAFAYFLMSFTGVLRMYTIPTPANEPNIKTGDRLWASNLVRPKRFDFICYHQEENVQQRLPSGTYLYRLCGLPGDKVQLIDGILFVNDRNADSVLNLKESYVLAPHEIDKLGSDYADKRADDMRPGDKDSIEIELETDIFRNKALKGRKLLDNDTARMASDYPHSWSRDNFGPLHVPEGHYFLLGDNRHGAADSRYVGLVDAKTYRGTVINAK